MMTTASPSSSIADLTSRLRNAVGYSIMAPSSHNTQPWLFKIKPSEVDLFADLNRACPVADPNNREMHISCGAALYQLKLAMRCDSLATLVKVTADHNPDNLVARVLVAGTHIATDEERLLFDAIPKRRTNRLPFSQRDIDPQLQAEWINDVESEHAWIHLIHEEQGKYVLADLVAEGDRLQASDKNFRHELAKWIHSNTSSRRDGIPGFSQGMGDLVSQFGWLAVRTFNWGDGQAAKDRQLAEGSPLLAVIGTRGDTPADWVACGQALAKLLLRAASWSVDASYLNQPIELPHLRDKLTKLLGAKGHPQILLRLGHGSEVRPTPRRDLDDVIIE